MFKINSDKAWKRFGKKNPYYGVLTNEKFLDDNLTEAQKKVFFQTGETHVSNVFNLIKTHFRMECSPQIVLDFGCGTGRLVIPFAKRSEKTIGVDVSEGMLKIAQENCLERDISNATFVLSDPDLSNIANNTIDLAHSHIVFQHINVKKGEQIVLALLEKLKRGGVGVLQFSYHSERPTHYQLLNYINNRIPFLNCLVNIIRGFPFSLPLIQMNPYNLSKVFAILQKNGVNNVQSILSQQKGMHSVVLLFRKN